MAMSAVSNGAAVCVSQQTLAVTSLEAHSESVFTEKRQHCHRSRHEHMAEFSLFSQRLLDSLCPLASWFVSAASACASMPRRTCHSLRASLHPYLERSGARSDHPPTRRPARALSLQCLPCPLHSFGIQALRPVPSDHICCSGRTND